MPRDLKIFYQDEWFLQEEEREDGTSGYPIYYRYAITYSIMRNILKGKDQTWVAEELDKLINSIKENKSCCIKNFIQLYPLAEERGYVLVDQTNSYYPLVFYSQFNQRDGEERVKPLMHSLKDIRKGLKEIYEKLTQLKTEEEWTPKFQRELFDLFPDNSSKKGQN